MIGASELRKVKGKTEETGSGIKQNRLRWLGHLLRIRPNKMLAAVTRIDKMAISSRSRLDYLNKSNHLREPCQNIYS